MTSTPRAEPDRLIDVNLNEAIRAFLLLEELVSFLHQPGHYKTEKDVLEWLQKGAYPSGVFKELSEVYYKIVSGWMPPDITEQIDNR